jgi:hypothetical protein
MPAELASGVEDIARTAIRVERQLEGEWKRVRRLEKDLKRERGSNFPYADEEVLAVLASLYVDKPVAAKAIAVALHPDPTHSTCVRVGNALARLREVGRVRSVPGPRPDHGEQRWLPTDASGEAI